MGDDLPREWERGGHADRTTKIGADVKKVDSVEILQAAGKRQLAPNVKSSYLQFLISFFQSAR